MNKAAPPRTGAKGIGVLERFESIRPWQRAIVLAAVLIGALCVLLPDIIFQGKLFIVPDALAPMNFAVVGERSLAAGTYPLWNPYLFCGMPSYASLAYTPYVYPLSFVSYVFQRFLGFPEMTWLLMHYLLAGVGVYLLARSIQCRASVSILAGLVFMILPNYLAMGANGHGSQASSVAYMPFALLLARRIMQGQRRVASAGFLAIVLGFQMLRGHVQIAYYTYLLVGLLFLFEAAALVRKRDTAGLAQGLGLLAASFACAVGIAAVLILPVREYAAHSIRGATAGGGLDYGYATGWSLHPKEMLTFLFPWAFGYGKATYWGEMPFTDYPNYLGIVTAVFAFGGLFIIRGRMKWFFALAALGSTLMAFGRHFPILYGPMFRFFPYFNKFRVPVMALIIQQLALVLLMAAGIEEYLVRVSGGACPSWLKPKRIMVYCVAVAVALFLVFSGDEGIKNTLSGNEAVRLHVSGEWIDAAAAAFTSDLARTLVVLAALLLVLYLSATKRLLPGATIAVIACIAAVDLITVDRGVIHPEKTWPGAQPIIMGTQIRERYLQPDDAVRFFQADTTYFRIFPVPRAQIGQWSHSVHPFSENRFMAHGIFSLGGYHAAKLKRYQDVLDAMFGSFNAGRYPEAIVNMLGAKYFYSTYQVFREGTGFPLVMSGDNLYIYENRGALPRISFIDSVRVLPPDEALGAIAANEIDPRREVILSEESPVPPVSAEGSYGHISAYGTNEIDIRTHIERSCIMLVSEMWYPDWRATVDGFKTPILVADYCLRGLALGPGDHDIVMKFEPKRLRAALILSIVCFAAAIAAPAVSTAVSRRR